MSLEEQVYQALRGITDPESGTDIVSKGIVRDLRVDGGTREDFLSIESRDKEYFKGLQETIRTAVASLPGVEKVDISRPLPMAASQAPPKPGQKAQSPSINSKGSPAFGTSSPSEAAREGSGKSTVAVNLALALEEAGVQGGPDGRRHLRPEHAAHDGREADADHERGEQDHPARGAQRESHVDRVPHPGGTPLIWRGPILQQMIQQFLTGVTWGQLDYLVVDLPPGTGTFSSPSPSSCRSRGRSWSRLLRTWRSRTSLRGIAMLQKVNVPIIGIVENMSFFECLTVTRRRRSSPRAEASAPARAVDPPPREDLPRSGGRHRRRSGESPPSRRSLGPPRPISTGGSPGRWPEACEAAAVPGERRPG